MLNQKIKCKVCQKKYDKKHKLCPWCNSTLDQEQLHLWLSYCEFDDIKSYCDVILTKERFIVVGNRAAAPHSGCTSLKDVEEENPLININKEDIEDCFERKEKLYGFETEKTLIKTKNKEYAFRKFDKNDARIFKDWLTNK